MEDKARKVTEERILEAIRLAAIKQHKHPLTVIREMQLKINRSKEKEEKEKLDHEELDKGIRVKEKVVLMKWQYKIKELEQYHFEIQYKYYGFFGKLENTIVQSARVILPLKEFYKIERSGKRVIHSDIWVFVSEDLFGLINKGENNVSKIIRSLEKAVEILDYSRRQLKSSHNNFLEVDLFQKPNLLEKYISAENINNGLIAQTSFFKKKIQNDFINTEKFVQEELWNSVYTILKNLVTIEFDRKYEEESSLYYKYKDCLDKLVKWKSLMPLFYDEQECIKFNQKNTHIRSDQELFFFRGAENKILEKDLPKRKFLLVCDQPLGVIKDVINFSLNNKVEASILLYEFTIIRCMGSRVFHAYSVNENYGIERINENGIIQHDAYTELFKNFHDCRLNIDDVGYTGISYLAYQLVHEDWSTINKFVASYHRRFDKRLDRWVSPEISTDIYFLFSGEGGNNTFWNNRIIKLELSQCKTRLIPDYSYEECYNNGSIRNYCFFDGNLISSDIYYSNIKGKIIFNVKELKLRLLSEIKEEISFDNILKRIQQKDDTVFYNVNNEPFFSIELARKKLSPLFEKNQWDFLYVENKNFFLHLFLSDLFNTNSTNYTKDHQVHQFVFSKTKEAENPEFGKLAEKEVYTYLLKHFNNFNWSGKFNVPVEFFPDFKFEINWHNHHNESFLPYDISIRSQLYDFKIDVKATRGNEDNIFYVSIPELKKVLEDPDLYLIARVSMIEEGGNMQGIRLNSEMNLNFFQFKNETVDLIKSNLTEWENYYGEKSVRFLTSHFEQSIPNGTNELKLSKKFEEYQNSCEALFKTYFQNKVDQVFLGFINKTKYYSEITEDSSLLGYLESNKNSVVNRLCSMYGAQIKEYKMGRPK